MLRWLLGTSRPSVDDLGVVSWVSHEEASAAYLGDPCEGVVRVVPPDELAALRARDAAIVADRERRAAQMGQRTPANVCTFRTRRRA